MSISGFLWWQDNKSKDTAVHLIPMKKKQMGRECQLVFYLKAPFVAWP